MVQWSVEKDDHLILVAEEKEELTGYASVHFMPYLFMVAPKVMLESCL
jgi:hypothetical protein